MCMYRDDLYDWDCNWASDGYPGEYVYGDCGYIDDYYMEERWKPVRGLPMYWVSTKARVWSSVEHKFIRGHQNKKGYVDFSFKIGDYRIRKYLHRMMAEAFIPNPHNYPEVRHWDDNAFNNDLDNLVWGTQLDNTRDCIRNGHFRYFTSEDIERANAVRRRAVWAVDLRNGEICHYVSQREASDILDIKQSCISAVARGVSTHASGYYFTFSEIEAYEFDWKSYKYNRKRTPIRAINVHTGETIDFESAREASRALNVHESSISMILSGKQHIAKGWLFEYLDEECSHAY